MEKIKVEYMISFNKNDLFCVDVKSFNSLILSISNVEIENSKIKYKDIDIDYLIEYGEIKGNNERYFHIQLICSDISKLEEFTDLLKGIRTVLNRTSTRNVEVIWDDISFYYAQLAYPLIHEIENLMRKLITKFMLINVGVGWTKKSVPQVVKDSIKTKGANLREETDYLYHTDFIQLSNFLFEEYSSENISNFIKKLKSLNKEVEVVKLDEFKHIIPSSNWERYFSSLVDCEYEYLKNRWEQLYDLRCKVAHNNRMNRQDFDKCNMLVGDIRDKLSEALDNIDSLTISEIDKEIISESMILNTNELYGNFIVEWKQAEEFIIEFLVDQNLLSSEAQYGANILIKELSKLNILPNEMIDRLNELRKVRNAIVHENSISIEPKRIKEYIEDISEIMGEIAANWA